MKIPFLSRRSFVACTFALAAVGASAEKLDGPLKLVVCYAPGGSTDRMARLIAERLGPKLGVDVTVDNLPGDGGRLAAQQIGRTPASENVLMLGNPAVMVIAPLVFKDAGYEPDKDFMFLPHFFGLMVGDALNIEPQIKGYAGSAPLAADLAAGKIRILAVSGKERPSFAPTTMTPAKVQLPATAIHDVMTEPAMRESAGKLDVTPIASTSAETAQMIKSYRQQWEPVVRRSSFAP